MISPAALATISGAILAYEVILVRLFAIVQWHHFAFMAISIAMLGFGISGSVLAIFRRRAVDHGPTAFPVLAAVFALGAPTAFLLAQRLPFNALEVIWAPGQLLYLGAIYLLLVLQFIAGAACIGLAFVLAGERTGAIYFWNLLGSGAGALAALVALEHLSPVDCLAAVAVCALIAALVSAIEDGNRRLVAGISTVVVASAIGWWAVPADWHRLTMSEHKGLKRALTIKSARKLHESAGPLALLTVVESPEVPFRHAPGLSIVSPALPPEQLGVFADGMFAASIDLWDGRPTGLDYLDYGTDALVYHLVAAPEVLILDAGGGRSVLQAIGHGARRIDATEHNHALMRLTGARFADRAGSFATRPEVRTSIAEARHFLTASQGEWDVLKLPMIGSGSMPGADALSEDYLLTVEGLRRAIARIRPGGWLSVTAMVQLPPRAAPKLVATLREALRRENEPGLDDRLIVIRSMTTATVLAKRGSVSAEDIGRTKAFARARSFDLVYYPGITADEVNRRNFLAQPVFHDAVVALLGPDAEAFTSAYKFDIAPATDDSPFFHDFFKWTVLPEILAMGPTAASALLELGGLIVAATLVQAIILGTALVLLPLRTRAYRQKPHRLTRRFGLYFTALGLAFLFIEIAWIQMFVRMLGHPVYSVAVTLAGFLVFAGIGAALSGWFTRRLSALRLSPVTAAALLVCGVALCSRILLSPVIDAAAGLDEIARFAVALALTAPLACVMGLPFPIGLSIVAQRDPDFVPWAWGLNGCASVVSAIAATLVAMNFGFSTTIFIAVGLYAIAAAAFPTATDSRRPDGQEGAQPLP